MREYRWKPIEPLSDAERSIDLADIRPLYESWRAAKQRLEQSSPEGLQRFATRLVRRLSIETGILERLYDLDRGTTEALVTAGFIEDLVARSSTDIEPARLISILSDQEAAIKLVMDCVAHNRALTNPFVRRHVAQLGDRLDDGLTDWRSPAAPHTGVSSDHNLSAAPTGAAPVRRHPSIQPICSQCAVIAPRPRDRYANR